MTKYEDWHKSGAQQFSLKWFHACPLWLIPISIPSSWSLTGGAWSANKYIWRTSFIYIKEKADTFADISKTAHSKTM